MVSRSELVTVENSTPQVTISRASDEKMRVIHSTLQSF